MAPNPYAPPKAEVADVTTAAISPALWNPNAAANWSLLFSPAFGAFLHMKNWQALGESGKAASAKVWFVLNLVTIGGLSCAAAAAPDSRQLDGFARAVAFALLVAWYLGSGRGQASYVKERYGNSYPRRGWLKPLVIAVLSLLALIVVAVVIGATLDTVA